VKKESDVYTATTDTLVGAYQNALHGVLFLELLVAFSDTKFCTISFNLECEKNRKS
jgi:hypothetical protein